MIDKRRIPANERVAATHLKGVVDAPLYVDGTRKQVVVPIADLLRSPDGSRDRQLVLGDTVTVFETHEGWAFVQAEQDDYVGYLPADHLGDATEVTHRVSARSTHVYPDDNFKSRELFTLSFGSRLAVMSTGSRFAQTPQGFVPPKHLIPIDQFESDPVSVAERMLGTPYLWGGDSGFGTDCSGLVQAACLSCGMACPRDADMQEDELGQHLPEDAPLQRNDLLFWKGHVAFVADPDTILHANAFHMAVSYEPLEDAIKRIMAQGDGPVTARKRLGGQI